MALALERLSVSDLLRTVTERFRARATESGRPLVIDGDAGLVIEGDRLRIEQALTSMVDNALRHGEVEVTKADGSQVDVQLDRGFNLVGQSADGESQDSGR